jgi:subtilisin family serine protease
MKRIMVGALSAALLVGCVQKVNYKDKGPKEVPATGAKGAVSGNPSEVDWFTQDSELDSIEGVGAERAYKELNLKSEGAPVLVAIIDSGVDSKHEDLINRMWVNPGETGKDKSGLDKASNGIDDDGNGFVDDIHGWNFLGSVNESGQLVHIGPTTLEVTRELVRMKKKAQQGDLSKEEAAYLEKLKKEVESEVSTARTEFDKNEKAKEEMRPKYEVLKSLLKKDFNLVSRVDIEALAPTDDAGIAAKKEWIDLFQSIKARDIAHIDRRLEYYGDNLKYYFNENFDPRAEIIGDDVSDFEDRNYGNNDIKALDADHGTHVAGIVGAERNNGLGINGVADHVRFMGLRAVPNGDEYDKDVANAVRYAVQNGARIINMSFGKGYSPYKEKVDEAFQFAADNGVLIVHAAGNSSQNNNTAANFPNRRKTLGGEIEGWLEVGASSKNLGPSLPADFSNFGNQSVDLFAPGVDIRSSVPDQNQYAVFSGTSMASPTVAGVAALILSQYPTLDSKTLKALILETVRDRSPLLVNNPETGALVIFKDLSITGGVADVLRALKLSKNP